MAFQKHASLRCILAVRLVAMTGGENRHTEIKVRSLEALPLVDGVAAVGLVAVVPAPEPGPGETVGEELQGQAWARDVVSVNDHAWGVHVAGLDACCHWNQVVARAPPCQRFRVHFR